MRVLLIKAIKVYQRHLSPVIGGWCRFTPTCSEYAIGCVERHGALVGLLLSFGRLLRCQPAFPCGHDPVPQRGEIRTALRGELVVKTSVSEEVQP